MSEASGDLTRLISARDMVRLAVEGEVVDAILMPALFVVFGAEGFLFAVAQGPDTTRFYSLLRQGVLRGFGATRSQGDVVFHGSAVVTMAFD
jgi:hypothetical protein